MMKRFAGITIRVWALVLLGAGGLQAQTDAAVDKAAVPDMLRAGDVVRLWIWREEAMSGDFHVPESGIVVLPKIGAWKITDKSTEELKAELLTEYQKYLRNPAIEITFLRRINVLGAVNNPGVYTVDPTMTIAHALALAGGARPDGKSNEVQLYRKDVVLIAKIAQQTRISDLPIQSGDQLYVPERTWLSRNTGLVAALVPTLISVAITLFAR